MLTFSQDPGLAEKQMNAVIFYMVAFGYIDGDFAPSERSFVRETIEKMVKHRASSILSDDTPARTDIIQRFVTHFGEVFEETDRQVQSWFSEAVADGETPEDFVFAKLKLKSFEIFKSFDESNQRIMLETVDELIRSDGKVHPAELKFRGDVARLLRSTDTSDASVSDRPTQTVKVKRPAHLDIGASNAVSLTALEEHYSKDLDKIKGQASVDQSLIEKTMTTLREAAQKGSGSLKGKSCVNDLASTPAFLDGHVYWHPTEADVEYDLTILGDLHGCYSCLKAALSQSNFFAKLEAYKLNPTKEAHPKLILLGDYIDRGRYSYNGVLRAVMQLYLNEPNHVYPLRGNHEYYVKFRGRVYGGVKPAEAINSLVGYMPDTMFSLYMDLFEQLPCSLMFGRHFFVHAGIPRDSTMREKWQDLSSLNDPDMRFQMLWSDPSIADFVPEELQEQNARFPFGRNQFQSFMRKIGCDTMVRGHEKISEGFKAVYEQEDQARLYNLFSAGGATNEDLPENSSYRGVTPMALTMTIRGDKTTLTPWAINYQHFNHPSRNAFFAKEPEIAHKTS